MSNSKIQDILDILDYLKLDEARKRLIELYKSPEFSSYNSLQLLREILSVQYISDKNSSFEKSVKLSKVRNISASLENIKTGNGRKYDENVIEQISSFDFVDKAYNVGIYGVSGAGKTYLMSALCIEACREGFDCRFIDYGETMDELIALSRFTDLSKYNKKIKRLSKHQILFIDDFAISKYSEEGMKILYQLIKQREENGKSTIFTTQYSPDEWGRRLSENENCYGKLDCIRRRLTTGYTILIEKASQPN